VERTEHRVAIVLDPNYAERIVELARECHVWLVTSASNDPVVAVLWRDDRAYSLEEGVTTFSAAETPEASFISILEEVEVHHGDYSHDPPLSVIEVIGLEPTEAVRDELSSYGFGDIELSAEGFVVRRAPG
jgi:hypothetical protein